MRDAEGPKNRIYFDGSSFASGRRGGPAASAAAAVIIKATGEESLYSRYIAKGDSDLAEFEGLLLGLRAAKAEGMTTVEIFGDSRNVIDQVRGLKIPKKAVLIALVAEVRRELEGFNAWSLIWIPREKNHKADAAARECIAKANR